MRRRVGDRLRGRTDDERGQGATALLVVALLLAVAGFVYVTVPLGLATDAKDRSRTAADAAALAGAQGAIDAVLDATGPGGLPTSFGALVNAGGLGQASASQFAAANDGRLVEYYFDPGDGTAHATVDGDVVDGSQARSTAVAQVDFPRCDQVAVPTPSPTPSPTPDDDDAGDGDGDGPPPPPPTPPPDVDLSVSCNGFSLDFQVSFPLDGPPEVRLVPGQIERIRDAFEPRLID